MSQQFAGTESSPVPWPVRREPVLNRAFGTPAMAVTDPGNRQDQVGLYS
ncbi:hypothetical protein J2805_004336 [Arthrobacter oryzae]|nr:hypothetical protein [Arthrobacter oryzae]